MDSHKQVFLRHLNEKFKGECLLSEPLSLHTWYRIGGPADYFVYPRNTESIVDLLNLCRSLDMKPFFIGEGANLLASDEGYRGVVINLTQFFKDIEHKNEYVTVGAGTILNDLLVYCEKNNLGGLEYLSGIPGTVGGALIMNAGTHKGEIGDKVAEVYLMDQQLNPSIMHKEQLNFGYRSAPELQDKILLGCKLKLYYEEESILREFRINQIKKRAKKQPVEYPSCGSVFKRPQNNYVGALVENAGLKGLRCGDAMVSEKHGGFIVNLGNAKASEIKYLIDKVMEEIYRRYDIELDPEVRFVGF